ncbi:MAG: lipopolysaccharide biosynthesis protein [Alistipes sp.]|nr:lipopolysaccharide biosynthesis protein [Alistipes sp.]
MAERRLESKVASGIAWSFSEKLLTMLIQMVVSIIVARQLMPEDFGIMAILTFFTSVALAIVDSGFSQTLIRKQNPSDEEYKSVLVFNVAVSLILYAILIFVTPFIANFYGHSVIAKVAPVLFLVLPINSLCVVQTVMFTKEFRFALLSKIVFFASLISGVVAVVMAVAGCGIWSLVAQRLLMMGIKAIAFWAIRRWRTDARFSLGAIRTMMPFSLRLLATDLIASIYNNVAQLFIGKMHSTTMLGYYSQAQKLKDLPVTSTVQAVQGVTYPALSELNDNDVKFGDGYERIVRMLGFVVFPVMLGFVAVAEDMFMLLLGEKWMPTVPYFEVLALSGLFYPLAVVAYNVLKVRSDGRVIVRLEVVKRVIMTAVLCYTIPRGVMAVAWGMTFMAGVEFVLNSAVAVRLAKIGAMRLAGTLLPSFAIAVAMYFAIMLIMPYISDMGVALRLVCEILCGGVVYLLLALIFRLKALKESVQLLRSMLTKSV